MENTSSNEFIALDFEYEELIEGREWMECPEQRLVWAMIERSVRDVLGNQSPDIVTATDWLWRKEVQNPDCFSFQWCCETLGVSSKQLRKKILVMRKKLNKSPLLVPNGTHCTLVNQENDNCAQEFCCQAA